MYRRRKNSYGAVMPLMVFLILSFTAISSYLIWLVFFSETKVNANDQARALALAAIDAYSKFECNPSDLPIEACHQAKYNSVKSKISSLVLSSNSIFKTITNTDIIDSESATPSTNDFILIQPLVHYSNYKVGEEPLNCLNYTDGYVREAFENNHVENEDCIFLREEASVNSYANAFRISGRISSDRNKNQFLSFFEKTSFSNQINFEAVAVSSPLEGVFIVDISPSIAESNYLSSLKINSFIYNPPPDWNATQWKPAMFTYRWSDSIDNLDGTFGNVIVYNGNNNDYGRVLHREKEIYRNIPAPNYGSAPGTGGDYYPVNITFPTSSCSTPPCYLQSTDPSYRNQNLFHAQSDYAIVERYNATQAVYDDTSLPLGIRLYHPDPSAPGSVNIVVESDNPLDPLGPAVARRQYLMDLHRRSYTIPNPEEVLAPREIVLGPEPMMSVYSALDEALAQFEDRGVQGDQYGIIMASGDLTWNRVINLNDNFRYARDILDIDSMRTNDLWNLSGANHSAGTPYGRLPQTQTPDWINLGWFPDQEGGTNPIVAIFEALRQLGQEDQDGDGILDSKPANSRKFIMYIGDGFANCATQKIYNDFLDQFNNGTLPFSGTAWGTIPPEFPCARSDIWQQFYYHKVMEVMIGCGQGYAGTCPTTEKPLAAQMAENGINFHVMFTGDQAQNWTRKIEDPNNPGKCLSDEAARNYGQEFVYTNNYPVFRVESQWNSNLLKYINRFNSPVDWVAGDWYKIANATGGFYGPLRKLNDSDTTLPSNCSIASDNECQGLGLDSQSNRYFDPQCRSIAQQAQSYMEEIFTNVDPYIIIENNNPTL